LIHGFLNLLSVPINPGISSKEDWFSDAFLKRKIGAGFWSSNNMNELNLPTTEAQARGFQFEMKIFPQSQTSIFPMDDQWPKIIPMNFAQRFESNSLLDFAKLV